MKEQFSFLWRNGLSIVLAALFICCLAGQILTGALEYNETRTEHGLPQLTLHEYVATGHFLQVTFENWESEFLQMGMYVLLTVWLRQLGSSESKDLVKKEPVDREPDPAKEDAPWPVKRGGLALKIYKSSLSLAFGLLFILSCALHATGSLKNFNDERTMKGKPTVAMQAYMTQSRFWFESFQNWQSEFVAVFSIVVLSIYLRQYGSPESKPVDAGMEDTGG